MNRLLLKDGTVLETEGNVGELVSRLAGQVLAFSFREGKVLYKQKDITGENKRILCGFKELCGAEISAEERLKGKIREVDRAVEGLQVALESLEASLDRSDRQAIKRYEEIRSAFNLLDKAADKLDGIAERGEKK